MRHAVFSESFDKGLATEQSEYIGARAWAILQEAGEKGNDHVRASLWGTNARLFRWQFYRITNTVIEFARREGILDLLCLDN